MIIWFCVACSLTSSLLIKHSSQFLKHHSIILMELCTKPTGSINEEPKKELQNFSKGIKKDITEEVPLDLRLEE